MGNRILLLVKTPTRATEMADDIAEIYYSLVGENTNKGYILVGENTNKGCVRLLGGENTNKGWARLLVGENTNKGGTMITCW